jgi:hypothetical protein
MNTAAGTDLDQRARLEETLIRRRLAKAAGSGSAIARLPRGPGVQTFATSAAEKLYWKHHQGDPSGATFLTVGAMQMSGPLDVALMERALNWLAGRHEPLRTRYRPEGGQLVALVAQESALTVAVRPIREAEADEAIAAVFAEPFDLAEGPLVRLRLLRLAPDRHIAVLVLHHIISDLRSMEVFCGELGLAYVAAVAGTEPALPLLPVQCVDVTAWQRGRLEKSAGQLAGYWRRRLAGAQPLRVPADLPPPPNPSLAGHTRGRLVPGELMASLRALGAAGQASLFMVTLAAFGILMGAYSRQRDVLLMTPVSLLDRPEMHGLMGVFINHLPVRIDLSGDPTFREVLARVRDTFAADFDHLELPEEQIAAQHEAGRLALPVQFTEETDPAMPAGDMADLTGGLVQFMPWRRAQAELAMRVTAGAGGVHLIQTYRLDLFTEARVAAIADDYFDLLVRVAAQTDHRVFDPAGPCGVPLRIMPTAHQLAAQPEESQ